MPWKYRKLLTNTANAFQALLGQPEGMGRLVRAAEAEGRRVLDAAGIGYTSDEEEAAARADSFDVKPVPGMDGLLGGSTWQSLSRGTGNVETDYLNGEIVRIARRHGQRGADQCDRGVTGPAGRRTRCAARRPDADRAQPDTAALAAERGSLGSSQEKQPISGGRSMPDATQPRPRREPGDRTRFVALPGGQADRKQRFWMPSAISSFVGREDELGEIVGLIRSHRLVTLTRDRRKRENPARPGRGGRADGHLRRRPLGGRAGADLGLRSRAASGRLRRRRRGTARTAADRDPHRGPAQPDSAAHPGQLRASDRRLRRPGRDLAERLPRPEGAGHQPGGARPHGGDRLARSAATAGGPPVHRTRPGGAAVIRADVREHPGRDPDRRAARRPAAGPRTGRRPGPGAVGRGDLRPAGPRTATARRRADVGGSAPHAEGHLRLESRPAHGDRAGAVPPAFGLPWWIYVGRRRGGLRRRGTGRRRGARRAGPIGREVLGHRRSGRERHPLPAARGRPPVRGRTARGGRDGCRHPGAARGTLPSPCRGCGDRVDRTGRAPLVRPAGPRARQPAGGADLADRANRRGRPGRRPAGRGAMAVLVCPRVPD